MPIKIHPQATANFDEKVKALLCLIEEVPPETSGQNAFPSDRHVSATYTSGDIIGDVCSWITDHNNETVAMFLNVGGKRFGIDEKNYKKVSSIARNLYSLASINNRLSYKFIEKTISKWLRNKLQDDNFLQAFTDFLIDEANSNIRKTTYWFPIANMEVEISFAISKSEICPLSKSLFMRWQEKLLSTAPDEFKEKLSEKFEEIRKEYQGLSAVVTTVEAEPERAYEFALEEAQRITSILALFSGGIHRPKLKCASKIKGSENIERSTALYLIEKSEFPLWIMRIIEPMPIYWRLSQQRLTEIKKMGLDKISDLLAAESLSEFNKSVLTSILIYSKAAFTAEPVEKLIYMLSSLESILLKNENESIQQNLAERIAVLTERELLKRKAIIKTIKSVYGLRSRYLHHGHTSSELELMADFMRYTWIFYLTLIANIGRFNSKEQFITAIDDKKLS